ncbi:DMT family transporter [Sinorhizobium numidicum]|uniref:DMT family transporter n=1 Tax=Sinorhizobium numidicum TaxID=680248 RepID=A0ABY8CRY5_9HYPH|nr:DMT family transporter [Sinorhizobium numidicum]WEX73943.1 DMT family transporter [Sinorhizobium numidicum]WEX79928.1 DMT family transporter [Sinorhizobium numidicum]
MLIGILAGLTTCALWGLTFVAPRAVDPFSAWDLTVARYGTFGLACAVLMLHRRFRPVGFSTIRLTIGLLLGGAGYVGYFVSAAFAVQLTGAAMPPLIIGTMPVFLALIANSRDRSVPWRSLALPLGLIATGVAIVNASVFAAAPSGSSMTISLGLAAAGAALAIWIIYGLINAAVMRADDAPDGLHWTGLQGIGAALGSLSLLPLTSFGTVAAVPAADTYRFAAWALMMGIAGSWLATWCWVAASRRLPLALSAQLIVGETIFGLVYGFIFETRWPMTSEWIGAALQITGVCAAIGAFSRPAAPVVTSERSVAGA